MKYSNSEGPYKEETPEEKLCFQPSSLSSDVYRYTLLSLSAFYENCYIYQQERTDLVRTS